MNIIKYLPLVFIIFGCTPTQKIKVSTPLTETTISAKDTLINYTGRIDSSENIRIFWPGTAMKFSFVGTNASILLHDSKGENIFNIVIDGQDPISFQLDNIKHWYAITDSLENKTHTIEIYKRTEWNHGSTDIFQVKIKGKFTTPPPHKLRTIEFFGNSITTGYANEDFSGEDKPDGRKTNNYSAYAAVTSRALDADMICTARAGIGVMLSWFPLIMPEMYDRLDPEDSTSKWDFSKITPDVVVVNLFQNDSWLVEKPDFEQFKARFGDKKPTDDEIVAAYQGFIEKIRMEYPNTPIVCTLGNMDATQDGSIWPGYIKTAVKNMNDQKVHFLFFPYKESAGHPHPKDHQAMADMLVAKIKEIKGW